MFMLYQVPERNRTFDAKFVRIEDKIYVTKPNDLGTIHYDLAKEHNLLELISKLKNESPEKVDGGFYSVYPKEIIYIWDQSTSLSIPVVKRAREITVEVFLNLSLGFQVTTDKKELFELFKATR